MNEKQLSEKLSTHEINRLVVEYREGDMKAAEKLLEGFKPLMWKYLKLLFSGVFNHDDSDIVKFVSSFGVKNLDDTAYILKRRLRVYDSEELIHVSKVALLETAALRNNIYANYKYVLRDYIAKMLADDFPEGPPPMEPDIEIDADWVRGLTSGVGFCRLSDSQRLLVKMAWHDNLPDIHICRFLKLTPRQLLREKEIIRDILSFDRNIKRKTEAGSDCKKHGQGYDKQERGKKRQ